MTLPGFLISPLAGALLDRVGAVRAVILDTLISAVLIGAIAIASAGGFLTPALLLAILALYSLTSPLSSGGIRTLFARFVPEHAYDKANALDLSAYSVIEVIAPLAAGGMISLVGTDPTLVIIVAMYLVASKRLRTKSMVGGPKLGSLERLEHVTLAAVTLGFALLTAGAVTGFIWVAFEDHRISIWKMTLTSSVWFVYALVLHSPINPRFRGRRAAVLSIVGCVLMLGLLVAVQIVTAK